MSLNSHGGCDGKRLPIYEALTWNDQFLLSFRKGFFCFLFSTFRLLLFESLYPVTLVKQRVSKASFLFYTSGVIFKDHLSIFSFLILHSSLHMAFLWFLFRSHPESRSFSGYCNATLICRMYKICILDYHFFANWVDFFSLSISCSEIISWGESHSCSMMSCFEYSSFPHEMRNLLTT